MHKQSQESHSKILKLEEDIRALDMEVTGIKQSSSVVNNSRLKLVELLNRIQEASKQTAQKLEQNQAEQRGMEVYLKAEFFGRMVDLSMSDLFE